MQEWKGIRLGQGERIQLYNIEKDIGEERDLADRHPEIVREIERIMMTATTPSERYRVGNRYRGRSIWKKAGN